MYRLIATDIDDTLLAPDGSLPEGNHTALQRLHEAGVVIVFCSGRADISIRGIASRILEPADDEYYISFNGARVVTADSRTVVSRHYVGPDGVRKAAAYAREHGLHIQGYDHDEFVVERESEFVERYARATGTSYRVVNNLADALPDGSPKLLLTDTHEILLEHRRRLNEIGADAQDEGFVAMFSKPHYLEIVATGVNKGDALERLAATLSIPIESTIALGDGENDIEMITAAGTGLAVANATASARQAADIVLESRGEDAAMAEVARRFFRL
ncbi:MAG: Cof-type HAD-IIB family hydrolase [Spirochaetota bacterium]